VLLIPLDVIAMHPILFLSGEQVYLYKPVDDLRPGDHFDDIARAEAVELVLTGVHERHKPSPETRRPR
jgi:hypothetical protein